MLKKIGIIIILVVLSLPFGFIISSFYKDKVADPYSNAVKTEAHVFLDNPFQRILLILGNIVIKEKVNGKYKVSAYTLFGIPLANLIITCDSTEIGHCDGRIEGY